MKKGVKTRFEKKSGNDIKGTGGIGRIKNKIPYFRWSGGSELR